MRIGSSELNELTSPPLRPPMLGGRRVEGGRSQRNASTRKADKRGAAGRGAGRHPILARAMPSRGVDSSVWCLTVRDAIEQATLDQEEVRRLSRDAE